MALKSTLGFGMMRLPVKNGDPTDFDYDELNRMVDTYLEAGYNYFDTSFVYHNGKSEEAVRKAVVERYPRESIREHVVTGVPQEEFDQKAAAYDERFRKADAKVNRLKSEKQSRLMRLCGVKNM